MSISLSDDPAPEKANESTLGFEHLVASERERIASITARYRDLHDNLGQSVIDFTIAMKDGTTESHAIPLGEGKVQEAARTWIADLQKQTGFNIPLTVAP